MVYVVLSFYAGQMTMIAVFKTKDDVERNSEIPIVWKNNHYGYADYGNSAIDYIYAVEVK